MDRYTLVIPIRQMAKITIEQGPEQEPKYCTCCGNKTLTVHGFVYNDNNAYAVYFASWTLGHRERGVSMAIGLGEWGDGSSPEKRRSMGLECRTTGDQYQFVVIEPEQSPWGKSEFLGRMLPREKALDDIQIKEFFQIADHIIQEDPRVRAFLNQRTDA